MALMVASSPGSANTRWDAGGAYRGTPLHNLTTFRVYYGLMWLLHAGHETVASTPLEWSSWAALAVLALACLGLRRRAPLVGAALALLVVPQLALALQNRVEILVRGAYRSIASNGVPHHGARGVAEKNYRFRVPVNPQVGSRPTPVGMNLFGVAVDGVPFDPATAEFWNRDRNWNVDVFGGNLRVDAYGGHVQPGGTYHYHALPWKLEEQTLVGYGADGFEVYNDLCGDVRVESGYRLRSGTRAGGPGGRHDGTYTADYEWVGGDLDECNGHLVGDRYHYHLTSGFPYVPRLWRGAPDPSFLKRRGPPPGL